jgi:hypothetical protein
MSRLLFAAARGARIERLDDHAPRTVTLVHLQPEDGFTYRIHPKDAHLQYGPISTSIREDAVLARDTHGLVFSTTMGKFWLGVEDYKDYMHCYDELHRSLFLLILAEALADEGL